MRSILPLTVASLLALTATQAAADTQAMVSKAFGNTIILTYPDGRKGYTYLQSDGSYTGEGRRKDPSAGHWHIKGEKLCFKQSRPMAVPFPYCFAVPASGIEKGFKIKAPTGETAQVSFAHGHLTH